MMRASLRRLAIATLLAVAPVGPARAQEQAPPPPSPDRDSLELQVRQRMALVLRTQLGLTDDQMRRLSATNRRFERQRIVLLTREREVRMGLRQELESGDTTRSPQVTALLDRMLTLQRDRLDLQVAEQKELATFLTPVQRARYFGIEEQIRRRVMEMREQQFRRGGGGSGPRRPPNPPPSRGGRRPPG